MNRYCSKSWLVFSISMVIFSFALPVAAQTPSFTIISGTTGRGALYEIAMPTGPWNGELVVYAHGIVAPGEPVSLPDVVALREMLTSRGFALVYSSYSVNGFAAVKDGMQRTHQLRGIFIARVAKPTRVYLIGTSLGGLVAIKLAERFPNQYDGAFTDGSMLGGTLELVRNYWDARVVFDYFFPGVVPGTPWYVPPDIDLDETYTMVMEALIQGLEDPYPTLQFKEAAKLPFDDPEQIVIEGVYLVAGSLEFATHLVELTNGIPYDNTQTWYSGSDDDDALNEGVARFTSDPAAVNYLRHHYTPAGVLQIPVITQHSTLDPVVWFEHENLFADAVASAGASQYLLQRQVDVFDHTGATDADYEAAFLALVEWVHTGVKPQS